MKYAALVIWLSLAVPGWASTSCHSSERFGNSVVAVGDSERKVIQAAGRPDRERRLETRRGGAAGYRLDYYKRGKTVQVYVQGGVVTRICVIRD